MISRKPKLQRQQKIFKHKGRAKHGGANGHLFIPRSVSLIHTHTNAVFVHFYDHFVR